MAKELNNKFEVYAENSTNVQNDATYQNDSERSNGSSSGIARSIIFNTALRQISKAVVALINTIARKNPSETDIGTNKTIEQLDTLIEKTVKHVASSSPANQIVTLVHSSIPGGSGLSTVTLDNYTFDDKNIIQVKFGGFSEEADKDENASISINGVTYSIFSLLGYNVKYGDLIGTTRFLQRNSASVLLLDNSRTKNFVKFSTLGLDDTDFTGTFNQNIEKIIEQMIKLNQNGNSFLSTHITTTGVPNLISSINDELRTSFTNYRLDISTVVSNITDVPSEFYENKVTIVTPDQEIFNGVYDESLSPAVKMFLVQGRRNIYDDSLDIPSTTSRPGTANITFDEDISDAKAIEMKIRVNGEYKWVKITPSNIGSEMNITVDGDYQQGSFYKVYMFKFYRYTSTTAVVWEASASTNGAAPTASTLLDLEEVWLVK